MAYGIGNPFWYYELPEYQLEGFWGCKIFDGLKNSTLTKASNFFGIDGLDKYIQSVNIPQLSLNYENTDFNMINLKEKSPFDDVTMTFYDDTLGTCMAFFLRWISYIFDEDKQALEANWRYEAKDFVVTYFRQFYTNIQASMEYYLYRCLPKGISEISADENGGDRKTFTVTFACQKTESYPLRTNPTNNVFVQTIR